MRLSGKTALISGGASGIGAATAQRFIEEGARVVIGDIQPEKGAKLAQALGDACAYTHLDVTREEDWLKAFAFAKTRLGALTTIVNSAGVSIPATIETETLEGFRRTMAINLDGVFLGCKYGVEALKAGAGGAIVNVASTFAVQGGALFASYSASKAGVRLLTRSVALACAEAGYDIRVNCILPGAIHTAMVDGYITAGIAAGATRDQVIEGFSSVHPLKRLGRPDEPANAIVFLASDESSFTTGAELPVDRGYLA